MTYNLTPTSHIIQGQGVQYQHNTTGEISIDYYFIYNLWLINIYMLVAWGQFWLSDVQKLYKLSSINNKTENVLQFIVVLRAKRSSLRLFLVAH